MKRNEVEVFPSWQTNFADPIGKHTGDFAFRVEDFLENLHGYAHWKLKWLEAKGLLSG
jgi:hypothetical protein